MIDIFSPSTHPFHNIVSKKDSTYAIVHGPDIGSHHKILNYSL